MREWLQPTAKMLDGWSWASGRYGDDVSEDKSGPKADRVGATLRIKLPLEEVAAWGRHYDAHLGYLHSRCSGTARIHCQRYCDCAPMVINASEGAKQFRVTKLARFKVFTNTSVESPDCELHVSVLETSGHTGCDNKDIANDQGLFAIRLLALSALRTGALFCEDDGKNCAGRL